MQNEARLNHATMVSPSTGFASRVMARIEEREHAQARRRMVIGIGLLAAVAIGAFALIAIWIAAWISAVLASPEAILTTALAISPLASDWLDALRIAAFAILQNVNVVILLVYALGVLALTTFWAEIATGTFQPSLKVHVGGQRK